MTRNETVTTPPTLGAGRGQSYNYPTIGRSTTNNVPTSDAVSPRPGGGRLQSFYALDVTGAPPAPEGATIYNGRVAWAITSNAGTGRQARPNFAGTNRPLTVPCQTVKGAANFQGIDDAWCWSVSAILAFDAIPGPITGDIGLTVGVGTRCQIRGAAALAGIEFGPTGVATLGVICRQTDAGPVTLAQDVAGVTDMTAYHRYEIRFVGPTANAEAQIKFVIDGGTQLVLSYGAGTVLPDQKQGTLGFTPGVLNMAALAATTRMYFVPNSLVIASGPVEEALP